MKPTTVYVLMTQGAADEWTPHSRYPTILQMTLALEALVSRRECCAWSIKEAFLDSSDPLLSTVVEYGPDGFPLGEEVIGAWDSASRVILACNDPGCDGRVCGDPFCDAVEVGA